MVAIIILARTLIFSNLTPTQLALQKVTRAAEECSNLLSRIISPERSHVVLGPLIESEDFPINLAAVKMMTQIVEEAEAATVQSILSQITPSLLKVCPSDLSGGWVDPYLYVSSPELSSRPTTTTRVA